MKIIITEQQLNLLVESESKKESNFFELLKKFMYEPKSRYPFNLWNTYKNVKDWPEITYLDGYDENGKELTCTESLNLENSEIMSLTKDKLVFMANGDWQPEYVVTVKLVNGKLKVTECRPYDKKKDKKHYPTKNELLEILGLTDDYKNIQKEVKDKNFNDRVDDYVKEYNDWNMEDGKVIGYKTPSETSVLEFIQNHHEQYNDDKNLQKQILKKLTNK